MKKITLQQAMRHLEKASAVIIKSDSAMPLAYPSLDFDGLNVNDPWCEWMHLAWQVDGTDYDTQVQVDTPCKITEEGNLMLLDFEGELLELVLLHPMKLKIV